MNCKLFNIFVSELGSKNFTYYAHLGDNRKIFRSYIRIDGNANKTTLKHLLIKLTEILNNIM